MLWGVKPIAFMELKISVREDLPSECSDDDLFYFKTIPTSCFRSALNYKLEYAFISYTLLS